ncbi:hypothetical protein [Halomarina litorea]|uniref:hypothetical protein n=1 Tax=Halomarina litorea TaxID=2961595 RepID=UPI0020C3E7F7|nr:hypothetical protein [Halomarina sp. BCD28]
MTSTHRSYQFFINYLQNKITTTQIHFEDLKVRDETVILELNYEGDLAPRDEQKQVREVIPEYFLMACRKGVFEDVKGIIRCSENSDYLLFEFEQDWIEQMESQKNQPSWEELKSQILDQVSHSYGEEPEI